MTNDDHVVELRIELLQKVDSLDGHVAQLGINQAETNNRLDSLEKQQTRTNLILHEHSFSIMKLADKLDHQSGIIDRVGRLETAVFH